jgi:hypothetical protein
MTKLEATENENIFLKGNKEGYTKIFFLRELL